MAFSDAAAEVLLKNSARMTKPRQVILRCFDRVSAPLSVPEIIEKVCGKGRKSSSIDPVSVYRTIDLLTRLRLLHRVAPTGGYLPCKHTKCGIEHHVLMSCRKCQKVDEVGVPEAMIRSLHWYLQEHLNFCSDPHVVQVSGICGKCQKN